MVAWTELASGQRVQIAFASNPAGLRGRLSKAAGPPEERAGQTNPVEEQRIRDDPYSSTNKQTNASEVRCAAECATLTEVQLSVPMNQDAWKILWCIFMPHNHVPVEPLDSVMNRPQLTIETLHRP